MSQQTLANALAQLATSDAGRSETARLRDVIDQVEAALAAGVSRQAILDELHSRGFTMTMRGFETALYRVRQRRKKSSRPSLAASRQLAPTESSALAGAASVSPATEMGVGSDIKPVDAAPAPAPSNPEEVLDSITNADQREQRYDAMFQRRPKPTRK
ncbi:hypothetical protein ABVE12_20835 [Xanthomonas euvesicatoria]|uniref:Uncharacterized protein n=1 Tax=Xanthomonas euvesicatoria pv. euvesicatoria TaxID=2753541 RepID=A0ABS8LHJ7_XANEU|nr:hypothetical protein [Xanthomonas euvesicatoria]MCC8633418.1 hypothetical protein [Xanthomonas euvesicatoria pv. euvesicatoria]